MLDLSNMFRYSVFKCLLICVVPILATKIVEGSQPALQKTVEFLFTDRSQLNYPGACKWLKATKRQTKMCSRDNGFANVIKIARDQAIKSCEDTFQYDRWNCSLVYNMKTKRGIFSKFYRETAFIYALVAASLTHAIAKACASGELTKCPCATNINKNVSWKVNGCGDDFKYGKRMTKNFLDFKHAGNDQIGEILKQDIIVGIDTIGEQLREVCKCHGFSGSCTTKTCWKRLGPFNSAMGLLKKQYHHAVKKKVINYTTKRAIAPKVRRRMKMDRKNLVYLQKTPNLCVSTNSRACRDRDNCATLCCGRGYLTSKRNITSRCRCKMVDCCFVECDTCVDVLNLFTCK